MKHILIIAGEVSGDKHGAGLMRALKEKETGLKFHGIGGDAMIKEGLHAFEHNKNMAFLGLLEVVRHLGFIREKIKQIESFLKNNPVSAVILIDYPGFNLKIAAIAKKLGIPVVYYICPQVWAWGRRRVNKIRELVNLPLVILPFEEKFYQEHGIQALFVGHPSLESIHTEYSREEFFKKYNLNPEKRLIGLLPGSRKMEVESLLSIMAQTAENLDREFSDLEFAVSKSGNLPAEIYQSALDKSKLQFKIIENHPYDLMKYSTTVMVASGTASLETAILGTPSVVLYKVNPITYTIGKRLVKVPFLSLTNLILNEEVFPEFLQHDCVPEKITLTLRKWLNDKAVRLEVIEKTRTLKHVLGDGTASKTAANAILNFINA